MKTLQKKHARALLFILMPIMMFAGIKAHASCAGTEWSLGQAIEVAPTHSTDPDWPNYKAKLGICENSTVVFTQSAYFNNMPNANQLSTAFSKTVHDEIWTVNQDQERTYYVFESDWKNWERQRIASVMSTVNLLLLRDTEETGPGSTAYTPDAKNPVVENEASLTLVDTAWQRMYPIGAMFCQVYMRADGAKVKFGQRVSDELVEWFDIRYQIPVNTGWTIGEAPFDLGTTFSGYTFENEGYPGDTDDVWTARVIIPGYKHPVYTPENPSTSSEGEATIWLDSKSWQQRYPDGALYCQVDVRSDGAKVKFLEKQSDRAIVFAVFREIPVDDNWSLGSAPFNLLMAFPEYDFGTGYYPTEETTEWSARVYLW